jgi:ssDNA-binding Zn-finger/Zn-ribbon topoisomerase 1
MSDKKNQGELAFFSKSQDMPEASDTNRIVYCDYCEDELELSAEEVAQGWYVCPECGELSHLGEAADTLDASQGHGMRPWPQQKAECGHCRQIVNLSARQSKQGWFVCPFCHELGQLDDYVTCLSCGSQLELTEEEWDQAWYRCPECDQVTKLVTTTGQENQPAPESPVDESVADWVKLKTAVGPEEAALEVAFLRANGLEAYTWQQGAGRAYGLTVGPLGLAHIMVREDQLDLARSILEIEEDDAQQDDQSADNEGYLVDCAQCGTSLELSDQEVEQAHFRCPECRQLVYLSDYVVCPVCQAELGVDKAERRQGWYRCPECDQVTQL